MSFINLSLAVASAHPEKLAEFYAFATNGKLVRGQNQQHWKVSLGDGLMIHLYKPSQKDPIPIKGRAMALCLEQQASMTPLPTIEKWVGVLISRDAKLAQEPTVEPFGAEAWMTDPEGNYFLIYVPIL